MDRHERPLTIAMMALGGQGGGVLTGWLVETAEANGFIAQSTYVAGVAQRTGATVYCVEMFPRESVRAAGQLPVFTPYPVPGDVDVVIAGEMAEVGRAIEKGFVTPNITTLIASSHRVYSMPEKEALGDGIMNLDRVAEVAGKAAREFVCFDMEAAAEEAGSVISSVMMGAIAASGALPFGRQEFEDVIRQTGKAVEANLAGFGLGYRYYSDSPPQEADAEMTGIAPAGANGEMLFARIDAELPEPVRVTAQHGALRALEYQDAEYANEYLDHLLAFCKVDDQEAGFALSDEVARQLALQMCYEDTIRVADLKTRRNRFERIREQLNAAEGQPVRVVEYFHPRYQEFCDTLPAFLGSALVDSGIAKRVFSPFFRSGMNITTTGITGFATLHWLAKLKRFRRGTFRFRKQRALINHWLDRVSAAAVNDYEYALTLARCIEIVRGYGDTYERGLSRYEAIIDPRSGGRNAAEVSRLHKAALADEKGEQFQNALAGQGVRG